MQTVRPCLALLPTLVTSAALLPACSEQVIVGWDESTSPIADASAEQAPVQDASLDSAAETDGNVASCEDAGGTCVADSLGGCDGGAWAEPGALTCAGASMRCCLPSSDDGSVPTCESAGGTCQSVAPTSCLDGHWTGPTQNSCDVGVLCCMPGTTPLPDSGLANACETIGGVCVGLGPNLCQNALWQAPIPFLCGSSLDMGCCFPL
jgi:hypothetical protein